MLAENEKWLSAVAGIVHVDSKLPQVGATCTRWLPDAGRPDKETTSKLRDLLLPYPFGSSYEFDNATFFKPYISSRLCGRKRLGTMVTTTSGGGKNLGTAAALNHGVAIVGSLIRALLKKLQGKKRNIGHKKQNPGPIIIHGAALPGSMRALLKTW